MRAAARANEIQPPEAAGGNPVKVLTGGGRGSDAPAAGGGDGWRGMGTRPWPAQHQRHAAGLLGRQLQTAAGGEIDAFDFAHHRAQDSRTQAFFHGREQVLVIAGFGDDQAFGGKTHAGQARSIQLTPARAPQDRRRQAPGDGCGERGGGRETAGTRIGAGDLMQRAAGKSARGPGGIERIESERQHRRAVSGPQAPGPFKAAQGLP